MQRGKRPALPAMVTMVTVMVLAVAFGRFLHLKLSCQLSAVDIRLQAPPVPAVARGLAPRCLPPGQGWPRNREWQASLAQSYISSSPDIFRLPGEGSPFRASRLLTSVPCCPPGDSPRSLHASSAVTRKCFEPPGVSLTGAGAAPHALSRARRWLFSGEIT